jgi:tetratricopeptide (TPR) repeat protein
MRGSPGSAHPRTGAKAPIGCRSSTTTARRQRHSSYTRLHPEVWNVWDSYGEVLDVLGHRDSAIVMYQKALDLYPGNGSSTAALQRLLDRRH